MLARMAQRQQGGLRPVEEGHADLGERAHDLRVQIAAGERVEGEDELVGAAAERRVDDLS